VTRLGHAEQVRSAFGARKWPLWSAPRAVLSLVLAVDLAALVTAAWALSGGLTSDPPITKMLMVAVLGVGFEAVSSRFEAIRVRIRVSQHLDMSSVWTFAAAVVLPLGLTVPILIALRVHLWLRTQRPGGSAAYRVVFSGCTVWLACVAAHLVMTSLVPLGTIPYSILALGAIAASMLAYTAVNTALVYGAVWLSSRPDSAPLRIVFNDSLIEVATLGLSGLTALALIYSPWLTILALPGIAIVQRSVFTKELQEAATVDAKTGLLNATTWQQVATVELERSRRSEISAALLIIDMDKFKVINDTYGHLAGDAVLKAVAAVLIDELRAYDSVGRFGGEEFVAMLPRVDALEALTISDRILQRIRSLVVPIRGPEGSAISDLSASIGIACYPQQGAEVEDLLHVADAALYIAKREGRDRVEYSYLS
jgi:diguanylate cyclase (GGDEF)-like protein